MPTPLVLLHGLGRTARSMSPVAAAFPDRVTHNWTYPSLRRDIDALAAWLGGQLEAHVGGPFDLITHSMGGILIRRLLKLAPDTPLRRLVMMAPPNHGSAIARAVMPGVGIFYGPSGRRMGARAWISTHCALPEPGSFIVIAGVQGFSLKNPTSFLGSALLERPHDGTVTAEETKLEGMAEWVPVKAPHTWIMRAPEALAAARAFLEAP